MVTTLRHRPRLSADEAASIARDHFGIDSTARPLTGERDQNFRLDTPAGDRFVLKVANGADDRDLLEMQNEVLERLAAGGSGFGFPRPRAALDGTSIAVAHAADAEHLVRVLDWVRGMPLARVSPRPQELLREIGALMGHVTAALDGYASRTADRPLAWSLDRATTLVQERIDRIEARSRRRLVLAAAERFAGEVLPTLAGLRRSVIQNDANDHNLLAGPVRSQDGTWRRNVVGLLDVGDAIACWTVAEAAVAIAYAMLETREPLAAATAVASGFHAVWPLQEAEIGALFDLARMRLCLSVCNSAVQQDEAPDDPYLSVSEVAAWETLERLDAIHPDLAHYTLREACGMEPCPSAKRLRRWLHEHTADFAPVVYPDPATVPPLVFDLTVASTAMGGGAPGTFEAAELSERLFARMRDGGAAVGFGRYDEARCWYGGALFESPGPERAERRTVHIGIDLFQEPGSAVHAPLTGRVAAARINAGRLDYGPTLVLEHEPEPGLRFWTLYGHLTPESMAGLEVGDPVERGARIAAIGNFPENGDWPPHLHFQIIADRLDYEGDFPGVAPPARRTVWLSLSPDPNLILGIPEASLAPPHLPRERILESRRRHVGPSLSVAYRRPLEMVRGFRQFLYDETGQSFLDAVNNVPHVGHSHPRVTEAARAQNAVLNTNTRYLHENLARYVERLAARLPDPLSVCYLVCSGSEANELALRMARTHTKRRDVIVVDGAYHGNTSALIDLSPYKHDGPGGLGAPAWVHVTPMPDPYRGAFSADDPECGPMFARAVADACERAIPAGGAAAFFVEPLLGCGGQIVPPAGYLKAAFDHARAAGAVCVADEVQIGFGRAGSHFWAFAAQDAIPDIVTLGKPIGNGYPLAAVVTTPDIAASFTNGMEFFSTFGGNPVACAVGLAVLDVIEEEGLQENARLVGDRLLDGLRELRQRHEPIGDVRGQGLYLGAELVLDRDDLAPAAEQASYVINRMRELGVLVSTDGPLHNVVKIKPPLCFSMADAERLLECMDRVLSEDLPSC